jgi:hypothetical protein
MSYLLELGIVSFGIVLVLLFRSARALWRRTKLAERAGDHQDASIYVLGGLCYVGVALITQSLGYSKLSWWPLQLMIIGMKPQQMMSAGSRARVSTRMRAAAETLGFGAVAARETAASR